MENLSSTIRQRLGRTEYSHHTLENLCPDSSYRGPYQRPTLCVSFWLHVWLLDAASCDPESGCSRFSRISIPEPRIRTDNRPPSATAAVRSYAPRSSISIDSPRSRARASRHLRSITIHLHHPSTDIPIPTHPRTSRSPPSEASIQHPKPHHQFLLHKIHPPHNPHPEPQRKHYTSKPSHSLPRGRPYRAMPVRHPRIHTPQTISQNHIHNTRLCQMRRHTIQQHRVHGLEAHPRTNRSKPQSQSQSKPQPSPDPKPQPYHNCEYRSNQRSKHKLDNTRFKP